MTCHLNCIFSDHWKRLKLKISGPSTLVLHCHIQRRCVGTFRKHKIKDLTAHYQREDVRKQQKLEDILDTQEIIDETVKHLSRHIKPKEILFHCFPGSGELSKSLLEKLNCRLVLLESRKEYIPTLQEICNHPTDPLLFDCDFFRHDFISVMKDQVKDVHSGVVQKITESPLKVFCGVTSKFIQGYISNLHVFIQKEDILPFSLEHVEFFFVLNNKPLRKLFFVDGYKNCTSKRNLAQCILHNNFFDTHRETLNKADHSLVKFVPKVKRGSELDAGKASSFASFVNHLCSTKYQRLVPSIEHFFPGLCKDLIIDGRLTMKTTFRDLNVHEYMSLFENIAMHPTYRKFKESTAVASEKFS